MDILILIYLAYRISIRAGLKGQNRALWILITLFCFFLGEGIGLTIIVSLFYHGVWNAQALVSFMYAQPIRMVFTLMCGIGGYLLIRYILDRMPDKNQNNSSDNFNNPE